MIVSLLLDKKSKHIRLSFARGWQTRDRMVITLQHYVHFVSANLLIFTFMSESRKLWITCISISMNVTNRYVPYVRQHFASPKREEMGQKPLCIMQAALGVWIKRWHRKSAWGTAGSQGESHELSFTACVTEFW